MSVLMLQMHLHHTLLAEVAAAAIQASNRTDVIYIKIPQDTKNQKDIASPRTWLRHKQ